jgi:hypothetical protein
MLAMVENKALYIITYIQIMLGNNMARPREGDEIKRTIVKRGDKFYAYEVTSTMVDGKKKTVSTYLGRVDPDTKELLPKIPEKSMANRQKIAKEKEIRILEGVSSKEYGATYLLHAVQQRISLGEDLMRSYGNSGKTILAAAMAYLMEPGAFRNIEPTLERTFIREFYGLSGSMDSGTLSEFTKRIGEYDLNLDRFFELRVKGSDGLVAWDTTTNGTYSDLDQMAEYVMNNKDGEDIRQTKTGFATDMRGVPLMFRHYPGTVSDIATVDRMVSDIGRYGKDDALFVFDRGFVSGATMRHMIDRRIRFTAPANTSSKAVKTLLSRFVRTNEAVDRIHDGHAYKVWKTEVGVKEADRLSADGSQAYSFTVSGDAGHGGSDKLNAYVCFDSKKFSDELQNHKMMLDSLKRKAAEIDCSDPVGRFKKLAGKAVKHFDVKADGRKVVVTEKQNSITFAENRAGVFVMLSSKDLDWQTVMTAYDARRLTEQAFDFSKSDDRRHRTPDKYTMIGRSLIRFVALILRCELCAEIRESDRRDLSVSQALGYLNTVNCLSYGSSSTVSEITRNCRRIFELFGVDVPKEPQRDVQVCDLMRLADSKD